MECTLEDLKKMHKVQLDSLGSNPDNYMVGMFNGMEFFLSMIEDRDPDYIECKQKDTYGDKKDDLFEGIESIEVKIPENYTADISEEEKKEAEFLDTLNAQY